MNFPIVSRVIGILLVLEAMAMVGCGLFAWLDVVPGDGRDMPALFQAAGITALAGVVMASAGGWKLSVHRIPRRDAVAIVGLGWVLCGVCGALPFMLCPPHLGFAGGLFESVSGLTTTGATVIGDLSDWPRGIILWRAVTNWLGGIGILVLFVIVLSHIGEGGKSLFMYESSYRGGESRAARVKDNSIILFKVYFALTAICATGLRVLGLSGFDSITHAFSTISTGGFSPHNASVGYYSSRANGPLIEIWIGIFMLAGALNFLVYVLIARKRWDLLRVQEDAVWFLCLALGSALLIASIISITESQPFFHVLRGTFFSVATVASSTGFVTVDFDQWPAFGKILLAAIMIVGGCAGSTAGGIKTGRLVVFMKSSVHEIIRSFRPNRYFRLRMSGRSVDEESRRQVMAFIAMFGFIIIGSTLTFALLEAGTGVSMETSIGSVLACMCNVGPGFDAVGPTANYAHLRPATHTFLAWLMILGRLELFALLVLFFPSAWRRY